MDITTLEHFVGIEIPVAPNRECVDILIGQPDKALLTVLEEPEGKNPHEPNFVLTRLGPVASGGRVPYGLDNFSSRKVSMKCVNVECEVGKMKQEIAELRQKLLEYELQDDTVQPSRSAELVASLVEPHTTAVNGRYEIPVPLKNEIIEGLPDNYESTLKRTSSMRCLTPHRRCTFQCGVRHFAILLLNAF